MPCGGGLWRAPVASLRSLVACNTPPAFFLLTYSPSLSSCLVVSGDVASSVPPTHCLSSARCVLDEKSHSKRYPRSSLPSGTHGCCLETHAIHLTRPIKTRYVYAGAPDGIYCATQNLRGEVQRPRLHSLIKMPGPGPTKSSCLFLGKITSSSRFPGQKFLAPGTGHCS
jgi:hypothetical protein